MLSAALLQLWACEEPYVRLLDVPSELTAGQREEMIAGEGLAGGAPAGAQQAGQGSHSGGQPGEGGAQTAGSIAGGIGGAGGGMSGGGSSGGVSGQGGGGAWVTGGGGGEGAHEAGVSATGGDIAPEGGEVLDPLDETLTVRVRYQDRVYNELGYQGEHVLRAAPSVRVMLVSAEEWERGEEGLTPHAEGYTNQDGEVALIYRRVDEELRVVALSQLNYLGHQAEVRDPLGARPLYVLEGERFSGDRSMVELTAPEEGSLSGALNILAASALGYEQLSHHGVSPGPTLSYWWRPGQPFSCGSCYQGNQISLGGQVEDPDQYDDHIILHEMGHFMVDVWSLDSSPGGAHRGRLVSPALAYGEGVAYFWSALVLRAPLIIDWIYPNPWTVDLETGLLNGAQTSIGVNADGRHHEELVSAYLWDAYDEEEDTHGAGVDRLSLSEAQIMSVLLEALPGRTVEYLTPAVELADWIEAARCVSPESAEGLTQLAATRSYPWSAGGSGLDLETGLITSGECGLKGRPLYVLEERGDALWLVANPARPERAFAPGEVTLQLGVPPALKPHPKGVVYCATLPCRVSGATERASRHALKVPIVARLGDHSASWRSSLAERALLEGGRSGSVKAIKKAPLGALWVERSAR